MAAQSNASVLVVGGGIVGLIAARVLARSGIDVVVLEKGTVGNEASWAAAGMLIPLAESDPGPFRALALESFRMHEQWVREIEADTGQMVGFERTGQLSFAQTPEGIAKLKRMFTELPDDSDAEWLEASEIRMLEPALATETAAAVLFPRDAHVDNRRLVPALLESARRAGALVQERTEVVGVEKGNPEGVRVHTADGTTWQAAQVVMAAGAWCSQISGVHASLAMRPVRGQMLALRCPRPLPISHLLDGEEVYLVPREPRVLVGGTKEDRGFDRTVDPETTMRQRAAAVAAVPALASADLDESWIGFRPHSANGLPVFDWDPDIPDLFYATGHYRNGILLAPITEQVIGRAIRAEPLPSVADPFRLPT